MFALELLHNAVDAADYQRLHNDLEAAFDWLRPDAETAAIAMRLQHRMAGTGPTAHRVKTPDLLIAALAVQHGVGVLHYDSDYDLIRDRGGEPFMSKWLAPRASLESRPRLATERRKAFRKAFGERMVQLGDDADLELWPELIAWLDEQLRSRKLQSPPPPSVP